MSKLILLIFFIFLAPVSKAESVRPDLEGTAKVIEAKTDYERMLIEARLAASEIKLNEAKAAYEWQKVAHIKAYMAAMQRELERVYREEETIAQRTHIVRVQAELCSGLAEGDTSSGAFRGIRYFIRHFLKISDTKKIMFEKVEKLEATNFMANDGFSTPIDFPGGNIGKLLSFAEDNDYSFSPWDTAHGLILDLVDAIAIAGQQKVLEYQRYMDGIRAGTLDVFELPYE